MNLSLPNDQLGRPLRDLRISITDRCNFRCEYCMPREHFGAGHKFLDRRELLSFEEITRVASLATRLGVRKVRVTGGEPLLRHDLDILITHLTRLQGISDVGLTTNGMLLTPHVAESLLSAGLRRITISLDALDDRVFGKINGMGQPVGQVLESINLAKDIGFDPVKVNMVVMKGVNDCEILPMVEHFRDSGVILRFIEFMDVGNSNDWRPGEVMTGAEVIERVRSRHPLNPLTPNYRGEVATRWQLADGSQELGLINSLSAPFCRDCSRLRLSAEGKLYTCLFASSGLDLLTPIRAGASDDDLISLMSETWGNREDQYSELRKQQSGSGEKIEMSYIGG